MTIDQLRRVEVEIFRAYRKSNFPDLGQLHWMMLHYILDNSGEPTSQTAIGEFFNVDRNTSSRVLRRLEAKELVVRELTPENLRKLVIKTTSFGRELIQYDPLKTVVSGKTKGLL